VKVKIRKLPMGYTGEDMLLAIGKKPKNFEGYQVKSTRRGSKTARHISSQNARFRRLEKK